MRYIFAYVSRVSWEEMALRNAIMIIGYVFGLRGTHITDDLMRMPAVQYIEIDTAQAPS